MKETVAAALLLLPLITGTALLAGCDTQTHDAAPDPHEVPSIAPSMPTTVSDPSATAALRSFEGRDANHDGYVSSAENAAAADNVFDAIDKDGDGEITPPELDAARMALHLPLMPGSAELIARADQDHDWRLTLAEWITQEGRDFKAADADDDGRLSRAEWLKRSMMLEPTGAGGAVAPSGSATP